MSRKKNSPTKSNVTKFEIKKLSKKVNVTISERFYNQVRYLCNKISEVEWSGVLLYSTKGDISDIDKFSITLEYIYPMDKGSGGATSYELGTDFVAFRMKHKESLKWKMGHVHSHNKMQAFFSGTDNDELSDNAENYNYYLSVVTNNNLDFVGKLVFIGESDSGFRYKCKDTQGKQYTLELKQDSKVLFERECKFKLPKAASVDDDFKKRVNEIIEDAKTSVHINTTTGNPYWDNQYGSYGTGFGYGYGSGRMSTVTDNPKKPIDEIVDVLDTQYSDAIRFLGYWLSDDGIVTLNLSDIVDRFDIKLKASHWVKSKLDSIRGNFMMYARAAAFEDLEDGDFVDYLDDIVTISEELKDYYPEFNKLITEYFDNVTDDYYNHKKVLPL